METRVYANGHQVCLQNALSQHKTGNWKEVDRDGHGSNLVHSSGQTCMKCDQCIVTRTIPAES